MDSVHNLIQWINEIHCHGFPTQPWPLMRKLVPVREHDISATIYVNASGHWIAALDKTRTPCQFWIVPRLLADRKSAKAPMCERATSFRCRPISLTFTPTTYRCSLRWNSRRVDFVLSPCPSVFDSYSLSTLRASCMCPRSCAHWDGRFLSFSPVSSFVHTLRRPRSSPPIYFLV